MKNVAALREEVYGRYLIAGTSSTNALLQGLPRIELEQISGQGSTWLVNQASVHI
jgi:hypothetical protein